MTAPVITSISPTTFDPGGGTSVTINGSNFTGTTQVKIGGYAVSFTVNSSTKITATAPSYAQALSGNYNLVVTNASDGGSYDNEWTWTPPNITSISPNSGGPAGGGTCTITGTYLDAAEYAPAPGAKQTFAATTKRRCSRHQGAHQVDGRTASDDA